jgi:hypothetical protein
VGATNPQDQLPAQVGRSIVDVGFSPRQSRLVHLGVSGEALGCGDRRFHLPQFLSELDGCVVTVRLVAARHADRLVEGVSVVDECG